MNLNKSWISFLLITLTLNAKNCCGDLSTSIEAISNVITIEKVLNKNLENYITENELKLTFLKEKLKRSKEENAKALNDPQEYVMNPLGAFSLIRRLAEDWKKLDQFMENDPGQAYRQNILDQRKSIRYPTADDVSDAVDGMLRLQEIYKISPTDMASGVLNNVQYDFKLSSLDCTCIGYHAYKSEKDKTYFANLWFQEAIRLFQDTVENSVFGLRLTNILEAAANNKQKQGDLQGALDYLHNIKEEESILIAEKKINLRQQLDKNIADGVPLPYIGPPVYYPDYINYEKGCRNEFLYIGHKELICRYENSNHKFLILAPIKLEIAKVDPLVVIAHEVIYDDEIELTKMLSRPLLTRATVWNATTARGEAIKERTSQFAWFYKDDDPTFFTIDNRIEDMTGLTMATAEKLQAMNYGLGGHYLIHFDYFNEPETEEAYQTLKKDNGNRISTVLFYLTDVEQGGATVFPHLDIAVFPKKGSAVFWYNLNERGRVDPRTLHAACPVLVGSKWVMNKWIREAGQIFLRPCV